MEIGMFSLVKDGLTIALDSLQDLDVSQLPRREQLDDAEQQAAVDVASRLPELLRRAGKLKRALAEQGHISSKRRKENAPGEGRPEMRNDDYIAETLDYVGSFDFKEYLRRTCGPEPFSHPLDHGLKCAVVGFDELAAAEMNEVVAMYGQYDTTTTVLSLVSRALEAGAGRRGFKALYNILDHESLSARGTWPWFLHMCNILIHIQFALSWRAHKTNSDKKTAREGLFKPTGNMTAAERRSRAYKTWHGRFEARRTACTRLLEAYETLGCIVVLHAGFDYQVFKDPRTGPSIAYMIGEMSAELEGIPENEAIHRKLVRRSLRALLSGNEGENEVLQLFLTVEAAVDREAIGEL